MDWVTVVSSIFLLVGAAMLIACGRAFIRRRAFLRNSATASGTIVALIENRERDEIGYFPKVEFQTPSGREITFESEMGSGTEAKRIGDSVPVRYRLDQPHVAEIDGFIVHAGIVGHRPCSSRGSIAETHCTQVCSQAKACHPAVATPNRAFADTGRRR